MAEKRKAKRISQRRQRHELVMTSNRGFTSSGERLISRNEEFQSTEEEDESSRVKLQSLNDQLARVNRQLQKALHRERTIGDDLKNILNSSDIATLIVDEALNIRFFTPHAAPLFMDAGDAGRPLADLAIRFTDINLIADARAVLESCTPIKRETKGASGAWYLCTISPYRAQDDRIEGVVINLNDISKMRAGEEKLREAQAYANSIIKTIHWPLVVLDDELRVRSASPSFYRFFGLNPQDTMGRLFLDAGAHLDILPLRSVLECIKRRDRNSTNFEISIDLPAPLGKRVLAITADEIRDGDIDSKNVLVSFDDITDFKRAAEQLDTAKQTAERANMAKSRFLAAASHDLRQPLQTLSLLHGTLKKQTKDDETRCLLTKAERISEAMVGTLNAILDIDQLETGSIRPALSDFPINELLDALYSDFVELARNKGLGCRLVHCGLMIRSDRRLLGEIVRNLLSNAIRYTDNGKILLGCRRRRGRLRLEVWDTGIGVSKDQHAWIFQEYHRGAGATRRGGIGLGLAIVQRLGELLAHPIGLRSLLGKGSVFSIEIPLAEPSSRPPPLQEQPRKSAIGRTGLVLVIEDEAAVRQSLQAMLVTEGHRQHAAIDGKAALDLVARHGLEPDLIISDYNLPGESNGVQTADTLRSVLGWQVPVIILSGDVRVRRLHDITRSGYVSIIKPAKAAELSQLVQQLLAGPRRRKENSPVTLPARSSSATIFIVDDDPDIRDSMFDLLSSAGYRVKTHADAQAFLDCHHPEDKGCIIADVRMPGMNGLDMLARLAVTGSQLPAIVITGQGDIAMAVQAMRAGAADFIEKPIKPEALLASVDRVLQSAVSSTQRSALWAAAALRIASLTKREREVMDLVVGGYLNKEIALRLGINQRTVEVHRAAVMKKTAASSLSDLVRMKIMTDGGYEH